MTTFTRSSKRQWIGLAVLALPTLILAIETSVTYLALPHISTAIGASGQEQLWITDMYGFVLASLLVTMGTLGDRIGRRKLLLFGAAVFGLASIAAAFAPNASMLILARAAMGVAGATLMPSTLALISNIFKDPKQRGIAIGIWMSCFMVGMIVGPLIGGSLLEHFWWGSVFLISVPVMVLLLATGPFLLPEYRNNMATKIDLLSIVLSLGAVLPFIYGLKSLAYGSTPLSIAGLLMSVILGGVFVRRQGRLEHPLIDVMLFKNRTFSVTLTVMLVTAILMGGTAFFLTQYLQLVEGLSPFHAGLWSIPQALSMLVMSVISPLLIRRYTSSRVMAGGLLAAAAGLFLLAQTPNTHGLIMAVTGFVIATAGVAPTLVLGTSLILGFVPSEKAGSAAAISETSNQLGVALGVALLGSIGAVIYGKHIAEVLPVSMDTLAVNAIYSSIVNAVAMAEQLRSNDLLLIVRSAFTQTFKQVALMGSALFIGLAILLAIGIKSSFSTDKE